MNSNPATEWENVDKWYDQIVGESGHYYHRQIILPKLLKLLDLDRFESPSLLDLGCGQGILATHIPSHVNYLGVDLSPSLIHTAKKKKRSNQSFVIADICKPLPLKQNDFTHAVILLALQNVADAEKAILNVAKHLIKGGLFIIVLNHPCFRIPRQTNWVIDESKKLQSRKIDRYLSPLKIPIQMHPGKGRTSENTWSFHHSLSDYSRFLANAGFVTLLIEEWTSDKKSTGPKAKMENRAREEFPLFLTFVTQKI